MCGFTAKHAVRALRQQGRWTKPIFVITDTPDKEDATQCTPVKVTQHPTFETDAEYRDYVQGIQQFNPEIWTKWHKTQIFELLPGTSIQTILFIDADMLAQHALMETWYDAVVPMMQDPDCHLILYPERWYTKIPLLGTKSRHLTGRYNSGMWIAKRNASASVLREWGSRMVHPPWMGRDQSKLTEAIDAVGATICELPNHWDHVENQADVLDKIWFHSGVLHRANSTFLHMSSHKTGDWKQMLSQKCQYDLSN